MEIHMRRLSRILTAIVALATASLTVVSTQASAAPIPESGSPSLATIDANFAATIGVAREVVQGAGTFNISIGLDGKVTAKRLSGNAPAVLPMYPNVGPYMSARWHDAYAGETVNGIPTHPGHPYVCFEDPDAVTTNFHPVQQVIQDYDQYDFITEWAPDCAPYVSDRYLTTLYTTQNMSYCNNFYVKTEYIGGRVYIRRFIVYFGQYGVGPCFDDAEINAHRTTLALGVALGLEQHIDGAPSAFAWPVGNSPYVWPQAYDRNTIAYYN